MIRDSAFERLRDEVSQDLQPVRALRPAWTSAMVAIPMALLLLSVVLLVYGLRSDAAAIDAWALWAPACLMVVAAYAVLIVALVQRSPESAVSWVWYVTLPLGAIAIQLGGASWTLAFSAPAAPVPWQAEAMCFLRISILGVPPVLVVLWLLSRGFPLRPKIAGLLAGVGGGLLAEGIYRLHCGMSHTTHVVVWHTGAILVMGLLGVLAGVWWEHRQLQYWQGLSSR